MITLEHSKLLNYPYIWLGYDIHMLLKSGSISNLYNREICTRSVSEKAQQIGYPHFWIGSGSYRLGFRFSIQLAHLLY